MKRYSSFFVQKFKDILGTDDVKRSDVAWFLDILGVHKDENRMYDQEEAFATINARTGYIRRTWERIEANKAMQANSRKAADSARIAINREKRKGIIPVTPRTNEKPVEEPTAYMPDADMTKVSDQCLKDQEVFYDSKGVKTDRAALESLVRKYGKDAIIRMAKLAESYSRDNTGNVPGITRYYKMKMDYRFPFGKYQGKTIQELYDRYPESIANEYIAYLYYNVSNLDFDDAIIERANLTPIEKPGENKELYTEYRTANRENMSDEDRLVRMKMSTCHKGALSHRAKRNRDIRKSEYRSFVMSDSSDYSKSRMALKNQGH